MHRLQRQRMKGTVRRRAVCGSERVEVEMRQAVLSSKPYRATKGRARGEKKRETAIPSRNADVSPSFRTVLLPTPSADVVAHIVLAALSPRHAKRSDDVRCTG